MRNRPTESDALRAVRMGRVKWSDVSADYRDYSVPIKTRGGMSDVEIEEDEEIKGLSTDNTTTKKPVAEKPVDKTTSKSATGDSVIDNLKAPWIAPVLKNSIILEAQAANERSAASKDVSAEKTKPTKQANAVKPAEIKDPVTQKQDDRASFFSDGVSDFTIDMYKAKAESSFNKNKFNIAPNMLAARDLDKGLRSKDPDVFKIAKFIADKQDEEFSSIPSSSNLNMHQMTPAEALEYSKLKEEDMKANEMGYFGPGFDGYTDSSAEKYRNRLKEKYGKIVLTPTEYEKTIQDQNEVNKLLRIETGSTDYKVGQAMKDPLRYVKNPLKILGDAANIFAPDQTLFPSTTSDRQADYANMREDVDKAYRSGDYDAKLKELRRDRFVKESLSAIPEAASVAMLYTMGLGGGTGAALPQGAKLAQGSVKNLLASKLPNFEAIGKGALGGLAYLAAGYAGYKASPAVRKHGFRDIDPAEIPADLQEAWDKYGPAIIQASRSEYSLMPNPKDIAAGRVETEKDWFSKLEKNLQEDWTENLSNYERYMEKANRQKSPSKYYMDRKERGDMMYNIAGSMGASSQEMLLQGGAMATSVALSYIAPAIAGKGIFKGSSAYIGAAAISGIANASAAYVSRNSEFYSQFGESWEKKFRSGLKAKGKEDVLDNITDSDLIRMNLVRPESIVDGKISESDRFEAIEKIKTGMVQTGDRDIDDAIYYANQQADELGRQQISLIYKDLGQMALASLPWSYKGITSAAKGSNTIFGNIAEASDDVAAWASKNTLGKINTEKFIGKLGYQLANWGGKAAINRLVEVPGETYGEEVPQFITADRYERNELNSRRSDIASLIDVYGAAVTGTKAVFGLSGDERYDNNVDLLNVVKHSNILSFIMGATHSMPMSMLESISVNNELEAKKFLKATAIPHMRTVVRDGKTEAYMDLSSRGKQDALLGFMEDLKSNLPEGVETSDIDREIKLAKRTFEVMKNPNVKRYAKSAGGINSDNHKALVSLIIDHEDMAEESSEYSSQMYERAAQSAKSNMRNTDLGKKLIRIAKNNENKDINAESLVERLYQIRAAIDGTSTFANNKASGTEFSRKRDSIISAAASNSISRYVSEMNMIMEQLGMITPEQKKEISEIRNTSKLSKYLSENQILPEADDETINLMALSMSASAGATYEDIMAEMLLGYEREAKVDDDGNKYSSINIIDDVNHNIFVDKHIDAYRKSRTEEEDLNREISAMKRARARALKRAGNKAYEPFHTYLNNLTPEQEAIEAEQFDIDMKAIETQKKGKAGEFDRMIVKLSDSTNSIVDSIDDQTLEDYNDESKLEAIKELKSKRNTLNALRGRKNRRYTRGQIDDAIEIIDSYIEDLTNSMSSEAAVVAEDVSSEPAEAITSPEQAIVPAEDEKPVESPETSEVTPEIVTEDIPSNGIDSVVPDNELGNDAVDGNMDSQPADEFESPSFLDEITNEEYLPAEDEASDVVTEDELPSDDMPDNVDGAVSEALEIEDSWLYYSLDDKMPGLISPIDPGIRFDKLSHTLFISGGVNSTAFKKTREFLKKKNGFDGARMSIKIDRIPDDAWARNRGSEEHLVFNRNDERTYDNALISITIYEKVGTVHSFQLSMPDRASKATYMVAGVTYNTFSGLEIEALREFRRQVINAENTRLKMQEDANNNTPKGQPVPRFVLVAPVSKGKAKIGLNRDANGFAIQRNLGDIKGMIDGFDGTNWDKVGVNTIQLGLGRGARGMNSVIGQGRSYGYTVEQASGSVFVIKVNPTSGVEEKIKVNKLRLLEDESTADLIYRLVVFTKGMQSEYLSINDKGELYRVMPGDMPSFRISASKLLNTIVNFGSKTFIKPEDRATFEHLIPKQFYISKDGNTLVYGENKLDISSPSSITPAQKTELISYIKNNFHWAVNKEMIWAPNGKDGIVGNLFPEIAEYFRSNKAEDAVLKFSDGMKFTAADMNLSWTAWLIKNGKLKSDAIDGVFDAPYAFIGSPEIVDDRSGRPAIPTDNEPEINAEPIYDSPMETLADEESTFLNENPFDDYGQVDRSSNSLDSMTEEQLESELSWLRSRLGIKEASATGEDSGYVIYENPLTVSGDSVTMGALRANSLVVWRGAEKGTVYHEAFHYVSLGVLSRSRRMKIYQAARQDIEELKSATDKEVEEYLAEGFRKYMETGVIESAYYTRPTTFSKIRRFFRKLRAFVYKMIGITDSDITRLYKDIDAGVFDKFYKEDSGLVRDSNLAEFSAKYGSSPDSGAHRVSDLGMKHITDARLLNNLVDGIAFMASYSAGIDTMSSTDKIDSAINAYVERIKNDLGKLPDDKRGMYSDVVEHFDRVFRPRIHKIFKGMDIEIVDESKIPPIDENIASKEIAHHVKASHEISKRDNLSSEVKFFLRTIPKSELRDGKVVLTKNELTGMYGFVPFERAWNNTIADLGSSRTVGEMIRRINKLASQDSSGFYAALAIKIKKADENTKTRIWTSIRSHVNRYINISYTTNEDSTGSKSFTVSDAKIDDPSKRFPAQWGENIVSASKIFTVTETGIKFNKTEAESVIARFKELSNAGYEHTSNKKIIPASKLSDFKNAYIALMARIGISIDMATVEYMMRDRHPDMSDIDAIAHLVSNTEKGGPSYIFTTIIANLIKHNGNVIGYGGIKRAQKDLFKKEPSVTYVGRAHAETHRSNTEMSVRGADGSTYYSVSERNYVLNAYERAFEDQEYRNTLLSSTITRGHSDGSSRINGSIILEQLRTSQAKDPKVSTFLKIYNVDKSDPGRDFGDVSPLEDYIVKMALTASGYMTTPTMGDKNTFYAISGFKMPSLLSGDNGIVYSESKDANGLTRSRIIMPNEHLAQLNNYFRAEFEAIKEAAKKYAEHNGNKESLIQGYHYKDKGWAGGHGDGMRFRHFDLIHFSAIIDGKPVSRMINLNEVIDSEVNKAIANGDSSISGLNNALDFIWENHFGASNDVMALNMNNTFQSALEDELKWLSDNGLIIYERMNDGSIYLANKFIDNNMFNAQMSAIAGKRANANLDAKEVLLGIIANHTFNSIVSNIEFEKVVAKDPAFYGGVVNKHKRFSMLLSTGSPLRTDFPIGHEFGPVDPTKDNSKLTSRDMLHKRGKFMSAEIADNIMVSREIDKIYNRVLAAQYLEIIGGDISIDEMESMIANESMDESKRDSALSDRFKKEYNERAYSVAKRIADNYKDGYSNIDETDGSAFISPYMYRSILMREGKWRPEFDEAYEMMESDDNSWMSDPVKYSKVAQLMFGPLKMIYVGDQARPDLGVVGIKTHKMAIFCVTKHMATGDMKKIYDLMNNPQGSDPYIDFISVSQVNKTIHQNPQEFYTDKSNSEINPNMNLSPYEDDFSNLLHQLPTDAHEVDDMNIMTQVQKVSMSNVIGNKTYSRINLNGKAGATGSELVSEWSSAISALSDIGRKRFEKKLDLKYDAINGTYTINSEKMFKELAKRADSAGMPEDVINMFNSFDKNNPNKIPLQAMMDDAWVENAFISMLLRDTIDIKMPGGMYIQRSPFGISSSSMQPEGYKLNNGERLRFMNKDGSMDAIISISFFADLFPEDIKAASFMDKRQWLIDNSIIGKESVPSSLGYRIPTQGLSSVSGLKIVDVLTDIDGNTIMLPSEFTRLTGSDFDVDKLFVNRLNYDYEYEYDAETASKLEAQYQKYISTTQTTKSGKSIIRRDVFGDEFDDVRARNEFANRHKYFYDTNRGMWAVSRGTAIAPIRMNDDSHDKWNTNSERAIQNRLLETMLAVVLEPSSVHETKMPLDNTTGAMKDILADIESISINEQKVSPFKFIRGSFMTDKKNEFGISKGGIGPFALHNSNHPITQATNLTFKSMGIIKDLRLERLDRIYGYDGVRILDWFSALISAHVDVVKDPYIVRMGINRHTYKVASMLIRTGVGGSTFYYLSQPSMKELYKRLDAFAGEYGSKSGFGDSLDYQLQKLIEEMKAKATELLNSETDPYGLKAQMLSEFEPTDEKSGHKKLEMMGDLFDNRFLRGALIASSEATADTPAVMSKRVADGKMTTEEYSKWAENQFNHYYNQIKVLESFAALQPFSNSLATLVKHSQVDTKKAGNTFAEHYLFADKIAELISLQMEGRGVFENVSEYYRKSGILKRLNNSSIMLQSLSNGMLFRTTPSVRMSAMKMLRLVTLSYTPNVATLTKINKYISSYLKHEFFNGMAKSMNLNPKDLFFGENTIAKRLLSIKSQMIPGGRYARFIGNEFLEWATYSIESPNQNNRADHVYQMIGIASDASAVNRIKQYFSDLLNLAESDSVDSEMKKFALDFILYQFYSTGDNMALNAVKVAEDDRFNLQFKNENGKVITYYQYIAERLSSLYELGASEALTEAAMDDIFMNRWHDNDIVPTTKIVYAKDMNGNPLSSPAIYSDIRGEGGLLYGKRYPLYFVDYSARSNMYANGQKMFKPFVKVRINPSKSKPGAVNEDDNGFFVLYKLVGITKNTDPSKVKPIYAAVNKRGTKNSGYSVIEHGFNRSSISENKLPLVPSPVIEYKAMIANSNIQYKNFGKIVEDYTPINPYAIGMYDNSEDMVDYDLARSSSESMSDAQVELMISTTDYSLGLFERSLSEKFGMFGQEWRAGVLSSTAKKAIERIDELVSNINATEEDKLLIRENAFSYLSRYVIEDSPAVAKSSNHSMSYVMPANQNLTGKDTTTLELVESGLRTATTRSYPLGKVGDIITFEGRPQRYEIVGIEELTDENTTDEEWIKQWSQKEQWTEEHFRSVLGGKTVHVGSFQTTFRKIDSPRGVEVASVRKLSSEPISWSRYSSNGYEVSSDGDKRFSAFYAQLNDGRYIEDIYQLDIKGNGVAIAKPITDRNNPKRSDIKKTGEFSREVSREQSWNEYKALWRQYMQENPDLVEDLISKLGNKVLTDKFATTDVSQARAIAEILNEYGSLQQSTVSDIKSMSEITNHSGGAYGGDTIWDIIGREFGVTDHRHYKEAGGRVSKTLENAGVKITPLTDSQMKFAEGSIDGLLGKEFLSKWNKKEERDLQIRNFYQVQNSDSVFALAKLNKDMDGVIGGTGTAVKIAIKTGKPVYVWDINTKQWYEYASGSFILTDTPVLTKNFAGIGSRDLEDYLIPSERDDHGIVTKWGKRSDIGKYVGDDIANAAKQAVRDVYQATLNSISTSTEQKSPIGPVSESEYTTERYDDYGAEYEFTMSGNTVVDGKYKQRGKEWAQLSNPQKKRDSLKEKYPNGQIVATEEDQNVNADIVMLGVPIDLSKIGINFSLNEGQMSALEAINNWLESDDTTPFSLKGYAGTGKTSITRIIVNALKRSGNEFALMSPTHKAKRVLSELTGEKATTIHKFFKMIPGQGEVGKTLEFSPAMMGDGIYEGMVIIIDESSMIKDSIYEDIKRIANYMNIKLLTIGDSGQLEPVGNYDANGNKKPSEALNSENSAELTEVMRISNGNPLIENVTRIRLAMDPALLKKQGVTHRSLSQYTRANSYNENGGVIYLGEGARADAVQFAVDQWFTSDEARSNINYVRYIAYTNKKIDEMNSKIRAALGYTSVISVGESVYGAKLIENRSGKKVIGTRVTNEDEYIVRSVSNEVSNITSFAVPGVLIPVLTVEMETTLGDSDGGVFRVLADNSEEMIDSIRESILQKKAEINAIKDPVQRKDANGRMYAALENDFHTMVNIVNSKVADESDSSALKQRTFSYQHAITVHKSQGSEFQNVVVDDSDIRKYDNKADGLSYKHMIYTAVTRARHKAIVITDGVRSQKVPSSEGKYRHEFFVDSEGMPDQFANNQHLESFKGESAHELIKKLGNQSDKC